MKPSCKNVLNNFRGLAANIITLISGGAIVIQFYKIK